MCFPIYFQFQSRHCRYVTTNIWEMSGSWVGVGRSCKHPYYKFAPTQPPSDSLGPLSPYQPPTALIPYGYLRPILGISWAYIDHIFALHIGPVTFSEHFQHSHNSHSFLVNLVAMAFLFTMNLCLPWVLNFNLCQARLLKETAYNYVFSVLVHGIPSISAWISIHQNSQKFFCAKTSIGH